MLSDIGNALHDVGVATWEFRAHIAAAVIFTIFAWLLEQRRHLREELAAAHRRIHTLQRATAALAITTSTQDSPAAWITDGSTP